MKRLDTLAGPLKGKLHELADAHDNASRTRLHRAISWLARADRERSDPDAAFVFLWIAFNAAYAQEFGPGDSTRRQLQVFFDKLLALDRGKRLQDLLMHQFSGPIRTLIDNPFAFEPFWKALREHDSSEHWRELFEGSSKAALRAMLDNGTAYVLEVVFDRLCVLRNQLVHGGATWNSSVNRAQLKDGVAILVALVPAIIDLMLDHPETDFGEVMYPVV